MRHVATLLAVAALATIAGCATPSVGPTYTVYPGQFLWFGGPNPPGPWETYGPRYRAAELPPTSYQLLQGRAAALGSASVAILELGRPGAGRLDERQQCCLRVPVRLRRCSGLAGC